MPSEWREVEFGSILDGGTRNGIYKSAEYHGSGAKIVNMGELFANPRLDDVEMRRIRVTDAELKVAALRRGDLLFARRSLVAEGAGKCSIVQIVVEPTVFESSIIRARPDAKVADSWYLYYMFSSPLGQHLLDTIRRQVAVAGITGRDLMKLSVPLPPIAVQHSIARILSALDDKIELNRKMNETLEQMARAIFKSWFVDFEPFRDKGMADSPLGKIPRGWKVKPLPEAIEVNPPRVLRKGCSAPYLDMQNMPARGHRPAGWIQREFGSGTRFVNGDTLVARITPCLENGKTAFVDFLGDGQVGWGSTEFLVLRPKPPLPEYHGYLLARSEEFRSHAIQNMTGSSGRQRVPPECLAQFDVVVPDETAAVRFGTLVAPLARRIKVNSERSRTLAAIRDALLPKLMSGEVVVYESESRTLVVR